ncbi:MAG: radical SAM protein [Opitutales bacterium]
MIYDPAETEIRLNPSGEGTGVARAAYDAGRPEKALGALCHAPFVGLDFSPTGHVTVCNHFHQSLAQVDEDFSILEFWRGPALKALRQSMRQYRINPEHCRHCAYQIQARSFTETFARAQYDVSATGDFDPPYPRRMIFRLNNTCNQACVMCSASTSSRFRKEVEGLPLEASRYGPRFFAELEEILPHLEHIEFYGGEPFLVREHLRIFELLESTQSPATLYVNTNATALNARSKGFLERLNFTCIAVSMDAVSAQVHETVRFGLKQERFLANLDWLQKLAQRRGIYLVLNVTEHRKNWFELPQIFEFAVTRDLPIHINTCVHPANVTLYTLDDGHLRYLDDFFTRHFERLSEAWSDFRNRPAYQHLLSLVRGELDKRNAGERTTSFGHSKLSDGLLAVPLPGEGTFAEPAVIDFELSRMREFLDEAEFERMERGLRARATAATETSVV